MEPYELDLIHCGDCAELMAALPDNCIDLAVTSPPYDDMDEDFNPLPEKGLRTYNGYVWNFKAIAGQLWRVTRPGGVVVWVVGDPTINGSESLASSLQKIYFRRLGFNVNAIMIFAKKSVFQPTKDVPRYYQDFEYTFVFSKGKPKTFNPIVDIKNNFSGLVKRVPRNNSSFNDRINVGEKITIKDERKRGAIWIYNVHGRHGTQDEYAYNHPAIFPESLARDHIISWSNPGDVVLDPMCGSGTTLKMAKELGRRFIGYDISEEYCELSRRRVEGAKVPFLGFEVTPSDEQKVEQYGLGL